MNVLVLGGTGFIGSHLVDALRARNENVRVLGRSPEKYRPPVPGVEYRLGDFMDERLLDASLEGIDVVFHAISTTVPSTSNQNPKTDVRENLDGSITLFEHMVRRGVKRIIFFSSGGTVYGNTDVFPIPESHPCNPLSSYGIVKTAIEDYLALYKMRHGIEFLVARPSNVYGPRHGHIGIQGIISTYLHRMMNSEPLQVWGDGSTVRDYLYIDDLVEFCMRAFQKGGTGIFNVGAGVGYSVMDVIECISKVVGKKPEILFQPTRAFDVLKVVLDITKAHEVFHWQPRVSLEAGVRNTWEWMKKYAKVA